MSTVQPPPPPPPPPAPQPPSTGLPKSVTAIVVLVLVAVLAYNIVVIGPAGLPNSYIVGGLLAGYAGIDQLVKRKRDEKDGDG